MLVISFYCYAIWLVILLPAVLPTALVVVDGVLWPRARHGHCLLAWHLRYKCVCVCVFVVRIHWSAFVWRSSAPHVDACGIIKTFPHITTAHYTKAKTKKHKKKTAQANGITITLVVKKQKNEERVRADSWTRASVLSNNNSTVNAWQQKGAYCSHSYVYKVQHLAL